MSQQDRDRAGRFSFISAGAAAAAADAQLTLTPPAIITPPDPAGDKKLPKERKDKDKADKKPATAIKKKKLKADLVVAKGLARRDSAPVEDSSSSDDDMAEPF